MSKLAGLAAAVAAFPVKHVGTPDDPVPFNPPGYYLLVRLHRTPEKTSGGIIRPDDTRDVADTRKNIGTVVAMGPDAYQDKGRFSAPWCKIGDVVGWKRYQDQRYRVRGVDYVVIADDKVDAVGIDPDGLG